MGDCNPVLCFQRHCDATESTDQELPSYQIRVSKIQSLNQLQNVAFTVMWRQEGGCSTRPQWPEHMWTGDCMLGDTEGPWGHIAWLMVKGRWQKMLPHSGEQW